MGWPHTERPLTIDSDDVLFRVEGSGVENFSKVCQQLQKRRRAATRLVTE